MITKTDVDNVCKNISEPFMGAQINSICKAFGKYENRLSAYETSEGAYIVRLDNKLFISGKIDAEELYQFASFFNIKTAEGLKEDIFNMSRDFSCHNVYVFNEKTVFSPTSDGISEIFENMKIPFEILKKADDNFANSTEYDYWLSDLRCLQNNGLCNIFTAENKSVGAVTARGLGYSLISELATVPESRKKGLASKIIKNICQNELKKGQIPYLISKDDVSGLFYEKLGFIKKGEKIIVRI